MHYGFVYSSLSFKQNITGCLETSCCLARCLLGWWHVWRMKLKTKTNNNKKTPLTLYWCLNIFIFLGKKKVLWWYSMVQLLYGDTMVRNDYHMPWFFIVLQCTSKNNKKKCLHGTMSKSHPNWSAILSNIIAHFLPLSITNFVENIFPAQLDFFFFIWCNVSIFIHNICQPAPLFSSLRQQTVCTETPRSVWKFKEWLSLSHFSVFNFKGSLLSVAELLLEINEHIWWGLHCSHRKCPSTALWFMDSRQCMSCNLRGVCFSSWRWNFKIPRLITPL